MKVICTPILVDLFLNPVCKARTPGSCFQLPPHSYMHTYKHSCIPKKYTHWPQFPYICLEKKKKKTVVQLTLMNICWIQLNETVKIYLLKPKVLPLANYSVACCSITKLCPTLCASVDCSTPDSSVFHCLPEIAQTHVHWACEDI